MDGKSGRTVMSDTKVNCHRVPFKSIKTYTYFLFFLYFCCMFLFHFNINTNTSATIYFCVLQKCPVWFTEWEILWWSPKISFSSMVNSTYARSNVKWLALQILSLASALVTSVHVLIGWGDKMMSCQGKTVLMCYLKHLEDFMWVVTTRSCSVTVASCQNLVQLPWLVNRILICNNLDFFWLRYTLTQFIGVLYQNVTNLV